MLRLQRKNFEGLQHSPSQCIIKWISNVRKLKGLILIFLSSKQIETKTKIHNPNVRAVKSEKTNGGVEIGIQNYVSVKILSLIRRFVLTHVRIIKFI